MNQKPIPLRFDQFREINRKRCETTFHPLDEWTLSDWSNAMAGECGEACNMVKKIRRWQTYLNGTVKESERLEQMEQLKADLAKELGDMIAYADLLSAALDIDLGLAVASKFNEVSDRVGSSLKINHEMIYGTEHEKGY